MNMLDTVVLQMQTGYTIIKPEMFYPHIDIIKKSKGFAKAVNNPTKQDKLLGLNKPRLTFIKRGAGEFLKVEFSAPKLIYGTNVDELSNNDFDLVIKQLREYLYGMGVIVWSSGLENSNVLAFHPSKNILLKNGYTSQGVIKELAKINFTQKMDLNKADFRNNGHSLQFYSGTNALVLYDKIADLFKNKKRAIDKDVGSRQMSLFSGLKKQSKRSELLRFEVRLCNRRKIKQILKAISCESDLKLKDIFNEELCTKILLSYWYKFFRNNYDFIYDIEEKPQDIMRNMIRGDPSIKMKKVIELVGLTLLCKDDEGIRGLRTILNTKEWNKLYRDFKVLNSLKSKNVHEFIEQVEEQIKTYKPIKVNQIIDSI